MFFDATGHDVPEKGVERVDLPDKFAIHGNTTQGCFINSNIVHKHTLKEHAMQESDHDNTFELATLHQLVGFGRNLARIIIARMGNDQGPDIRSSNAFGCGQELPDLLFEKFGALG